MTTSIASAREVAEHWLTDQRHALHAVAAVRIALGLSVLGLLVSNLGSRQTWVGEASVWAEPVRGISQFPEIVLLDNVSGDLVTAIYVVVMLAALAMVLGRWTKTATVVTLIGFIAVTGQNPVLAAPADNLIRVALLWMVLIRSGACWSLDAARESRTEDALPGWLSVGLHNIGLLGLGTQAALVYLASGLDKVAQPEWQHGEALYSTFQLPEYRTIPWLADLISGSTVLLALLTWMVLFVQLFFVPLLLHRMTRGAVIAASVLLNVFFAIALAEVWTSIALIGITMLFAPEGFLVRFGDAVADRWYPIGDWVVERRYDLADRADAAWFRLGAPVVDWFRAAILRR